MEAKPKTSKSVGLTEELIDEILNVRLKGRVLFPEKDAKARQILGKKARQIAK